jgi:serine/arginine repetitive matrix protein 2
MLSHSRAGSRRRLSSKICTIAHDRSSSCSRTSAVRAVVDPALVSSSQGPRLSRLVTRLRRCRPSGSRRARLRPQQFGSCFSRARASRRLPSKSAMSYNGVGLTSARGSATNGYVQRNLGHVPKSKTWRSETNQPQPPAFKPALAQKANVEILLHEKKRQVELQVLLFEEKLRERGDHTEEAIAEKVTAVRAKLLEELARGNGPAASGHQGSHQQAAAKQQDDARIRSAFGIRADFVPGAAFKAIGRTPEEKAAIAEKREQERKERAAEQGLDAERPHIAGNWLDRGQPIAHPSRQQQIRSGVNERERERDGGKRKERDEEDEGREKKKRRDSKSRSRSRSPRRSSKEPSAAPASRELMRGSGYDRYKNQQVERAARSQRVQEERRSERAARSQAERAGLEPLGKEQGRWSAGDRRHDSRSRSRSPRRRDHRDRRSPSSSRSRSRSRSRSPRQHSRSRSRSRSRSSRRHARSKSKSPAPAVRHPQGRGVVEESKQAAAVAEPAPSVAPAAAPAAAAAPSSDAKAKNRSRSRSPRRKRHGSRSRSRSRSRSSSSGSSRSSGSSSSSRSRSRSRSASPKKRSAKSKSKRSRSKSSSRSRSRSRD